MNKLSILDLLKNVDPSKLDYTGWVNVGMALHYEGHTASDWDEWSQRDAARYVPGDCFKKWTSFGQGSSGVTGGTIFQYAVDQGWEPSQGNDKVGRALDWDDTINDDYAIIDANWVEGKEIIEPSVWDPVKEIKTYLETLFLPDEYVSYVIESYEKDGRFIPSSSGSSSRTAGQLLDLLNRPSADFGDVFGDHKKEAGAWIRFNPMDGIDVKNSNVTDFRYALVESDDMELDKQNAIIRELELPVAVLMYSGGKSLHAIVKIEATNADEYRKRVDYLYNVCRKNGLTIDTQNRNSSRLSRMPGVTRGDHKQFIIDTNIGQENWFEWEEWVEGINDDLPDPESIAEVWDNLPPLAPPLIHGVLRKGHKMLMAGPSKAGKSFALIGLTIAIAEGKKWMGWQCEQGRVLYVNLELDRASALHRFKDVYKALGIAPHNLDKIDIWNLRGKSAPLDKLTPKLIRRSAKKNYDAVIVDPIYKVLTGDENSADQMAHFTNQFDKIATELGTSVIYCHHHSKGSQGGKKSMDRSSGSGVFARDPDALIDLVELEVNDAVVETEINRSKAKLYCSKLKELAPKYYEDNVGQDDELSAVKMREYIGISLGIKECGMIDNLAQEIERKAYTKSAWRVEGTLREYPKFEPVNMWFEYPIHVVDNSGALDDLDIEGETPIWQKNMKNNKKTPEERTKERKESFEIAYAACGIDEVVTVDALAEYMGVTEKTVRRRVKEHGDFWIDEGIVGRK